ncbi:MAG: 3-deoxy-D-manno-octulosonate 8-phosphate phosphatase [Flavobacteriales bacterium]|nr:3-deoxy-D-manno-octulosonate 8-phosphate phosphatase [Flavobacteriales bacterium]MCB0757342.1 HAD hydrolase family protein [Flavobacteriales bacterium]
MTNKTYKELLAGIHTFIFDVDGVFTDGRVLLYPGIDPVRTFHTRDAYAVQHALKEGLRIIVISGGVSAGVSESFSRLGVKEFHNSVKNKNAALDRYVADGLELRSTAYMGDDIPDLRLMQRVGLPCCPSDAAEEVKAISRYVSRFPGGGGCVRDVLEQAMKVQDKWLTEQAHQW